jgi:hypothetical protein
VAVNLSLTISDAEALAFWTWVRQQISAQPAPNGEHWRNDTTDPARNGSAIAISLASQCDHVLANSPVWKYGD